MTGWDPDLHARQARASGGPSAEALAHAAFEGRAGSDDVLGPHVLHRMKPLVIVALIVALGLVLGLYSPVPGLGVVLTIGGMMAAPVIVLRVWLGG